MELAGFKLVISEGVEKPDGYVEMIHNTQYTINLINDNSYRCDTEVHIDGKHIGTWRINSHSTISIERPTNDSRKFTFFRYGTQEAKNANLKNNELLGLVTAIFKVEEIPNNIYSGWRHSVNYEQARVGGTGLSGHSDQQFRVTSPLVYDLDEQVTIHLRLIAKKENRSTPIPPPLHVNTEDNQIPAFLKRSEKRVGNTGIELNKVWGVGARHALFHKDGTWYNNLERFPGALFDPNGYVLFSTEDEYLNSYHIKIGKETNIRKGISTLTGYVKVRDDHDS